MPPADLQPDAPFRAVVVAPTFNHVGTLLAVLRKVEAVGLPIIVVNDGSTDSTASVLREALEQSWKVEFHVVTHEHNRGKAAALMTGFSRATELGFTHAATIDTDGQHEAAELPLLLNVAAAQPNTLVIGERSDKLPGYPRGSLWGRRFSNLGIFLSCGLRISDSQCGLRVYPLALLESVRCKAKRYAFETEIITRAVWAGWPVRGVPITSFYAPRAERISHFLTWRDTTRCVLLQLRLMSRAVLPWPHRRTCPTPLATEEKSPSTLSKWRQYLHSITPARLWEQMRRDASSHASLAAALAIGTLIANLPVYPFQSLAALYVARRLHLQPLAVLTGSLLSTPPIGPMLIVLAIIVGHLLLHAGLPDLSQFQVSDLSSALTLLGNLAIEWMVGSVVVGVVMMALTFGITWLLLSRIPLRPANLPGYPASDPETSDKS